MKAKSHVPSGLKAKSHVPSGLKAKSHVPSGLRAKSHVPSGLQVKSHAHSGHIRAQAAKMLKMSLLKPIPAIPGRKRHCCAKHAHIVETVVYRIWYIWRNFAELDSNKMFESSPYM